METTGVLEEVIARTPEGDPASDQSRMMAMAVGQQRAAFQDYIEARLAFAEFLLSKPTPIEEPPPPSWMAGAAPRYAIAALTIALLCPALFGVAYLMQARRQFRDLEAARETMNTIVSQARAQTAAAKVEQPLPAPLPAAPVVRPEKHANATKAATPQRRPLEARSHYEFTLGPTSRWARVGPVQMSVAKLDRERNRFDLSVKHGDFRYDRKQVKLREAVWIDLGGGLPPVRVQADRIGRYEVHGSVMTAVRAGNGLTTSRQQHGD